VAFLITYSVNLTKQSFYTLYRIVACAVCFRILTRKQPGNIYIKSFEIWNMGLRITNRYILFALATVQIRYFCITV